MSIEKGISSLVEISVGSTILPGEICLIGAQLDSWLVQLAEHGTSYLDAI